MLACFQVARFECCHSRLLDLVNFRQYSNNGECTFKQYTEISQNLGQILRLPTRIIGRYFWKHALFTDCNQDLSYPDKDGWKCTIGLTYHKGKQLQFCLFLKRKFLVSFKSKSANLGFEEVLSCRVVKFNYVTQFILSVLSRFGEICQSTVLSHTRSLLVLKSPNRDIITNNHRDRRTVTWIFTSNRQASNPGKQRSWQFRSTLWYCETSLKNQSPSMYVLLETITILVIHFYRKFLIWICFAELRSSVVDKRLCARALDRLAVGQVQLTTSVHLLSGYFVVRFFSAWNTLCQVRRWQHIVLSGHDFDLSTKKQQQSQLK